MNKRIINNILIGAVIITIFVLAFFVIKPILVSIIFGLIFAYIFHPIYRKINKYVKNNTLSASLLLLLIAIVFIAPLIYFTPMLIGQMYDLFEKIRKINIAELITIFLPFIDPESTAYSILLNLNNIPGKFISNILDFLFKTVLNLPSILLQTFVFLFTFFFGLKDSIKFKEYMQDISPFSSSTEKKIMREFRNITNSVIFGQVLIGIVQGLALGIGIFLLKIPNVLTLTILTIIVSIIPIIGAWLIWIPLVIFLAVSGDTTSALILGLYSAIFVSNIDNFLRPYILSRSSKLPVVIALIGTIGGLYFMGIIGLVLGPLILAYALIIIDFYKEGRLDELYKENKTDNGITSYEIKN